MRLRLVFPSFCIISATIMIFTGIPWFPVGISIYVYILRNITKGEYSV